MKHLVITDFICKESDVYFSSGSFFESNNFDRVKALEKQGFIIANEKTSTLEVKETKQPIEKAGAKVVRKNKKSVKDKS